MDIIFLGTSAGIPTKSRNVTSVAVTESHTRGWYLIDCGEGTQQQLLQTSLSLHTLQAICITHIHGDHCYGLTGLLASAGMNGRKAPLTIIAPQGIEAWIEATRQHTQLYIPYELNFIATEDLPHLNFGQLEISMTALSHRVPSFAYSFTETHDEVHLNTEKLKSLNIEQGPLWGMLKQGRDVHHQGTTLFSQDFIQTTPFSAKVVICGDNDRPELLSDFCQECNVLVHEATYTQEMAAKAKDVGHSYARLVASFAESTQLPHLILTHFSPRYQNDPSAAYSVEHIRKEAAQIYTGNLHLAEDFARYSLNKKGDLTRLASNTLPE